MSAFRHPKRIAGWPLRRALDPRFADVARRIGDSNRAVTDEAAGARLAVERLSANLDEHAQGLLEVAAQISERLDRADVAIAALDDRLRATQDAIARLSDDVAALAGQAAGREPT